MIYVSLSALSRITWWHISERLNFLSFNLSKHLVIWSLLNIFVLITESIIGEIRSFHCFSHSRDLIFSYARRILPCSSQGGLLHKCLKGLMLGFGYRFLGASKISICPLKINNFILILFLFTFKSSRTSNILCWYCLLHII